MATRTLKPPATERTPLPEEIYRLNVDQYESMVSAGLFTKHDKIHLINGILVAKMTTKPPHVIACEKTRDALLRIVLKGWRVMVEAPVRIPNNNEPGARPGPGARQSGRSIAARHPEPADLALIIEVAESSLRQDRRSDADLRPRAACRLSGSSIWSTVRSRPIPIHLHRLS